MGLHFIKEIPLEGNKIVSCSIINGPKTCAGKGKAVSAAGAIAPTADFRFRCKAHDIDLGIVEDYHIETTGTSFSGGPKGNPILFFHTTAETCKQFDETMLKGKARLLHCCSAWDEKGECKID